MSDGLADVVSAAGWRVRQVRDADAEDLIALIGGVFDEYEGCVLDLDDLDADLPAWASHLEDRGGAGWVVLDKDDRVVACVGAAPASLAGAAAGRGVPTRRAVELKRLYVHADARGRGLGTALVDHVEAWASELDAAAVVLWSDTRFDDAHRLYQRCGYRRTGRSRDLHDPSHTTEDEFVHDLSSA